MVLVLWVVVQAAPVAIREASPRLEDAVDLGEELHFVDGVAEGADLVRRVEGLAAERQGVVEAAVQELELHAAREALLGELQRVVDLALVVVEPDDAGAAEGRNLVGDAALPAAEVEDALAHAGADHRRHLLLEEPLVLLVPGRGVEHGGDVHLLDVPQGAEVVQDVVPIDDFVLLLLASDLLLPHDLVRREVRVDALLRHAPQGPQLLQEGHLPLDEARRRRGLRVRRLPPLGAARLRDAHGVGRTTPPKGHTHARSLALSLHTARTQMA
mmetsp:Transcript_56171/g.157627  ORF Transcript_56171/g.157627 Transcript_56171/m.157627 type:complete len:271 (+) Transcript_56171:964-1776(+)